MSVIDTLSQAFMKFPGIGTRQAKRFVYFLLAQDPEFLEDFSRDIAELKKTITQCPECFRFYQRTTNDEVCTTCAGDADNSMLLVLEKDTDFESMRRSGSYAGRYFILGGTIPVLEQDPLSKIRVRELINRIELGVSEGLSEIIIALSVNPDGEATRNFVINMIEPFVKKYNITVTTLGRGLSTGSELEYSDSDTLRNALKNRK